MNLKSSMIELDFLKERFSNKYNLDDYQFMLVAESLRDFYFAVKLATDDNMSLPMYQILVDELWHLHIIYTKEYFAFSNDVFGTYLHHKPASSEDLSNIDVEKSRKEKRALHKYLKIVKSKRVYDESELNEFSMKHDDFILFFNYENLLSDLSYEDSLKKSIKFFKENQII